MAETSGTRTQQTSRGTRYETILQRARTRYGRAAERAAEAERTFERTPASRTNVVAAIEAERRAGQALNLRNRIMERMGMQTRTPAPATPAELARQARAAAARRKAR